MPSEEALASPARRRVTVGKLLKALRAFSLPVTLLPVFVAVAAAVPARQWRWGVLLASAAGAVLLHLTGNLLNDYFDFLSKVDRRTHNDDFRPGRLLVWDQLLPRDILIEAMVCLAAAGVVTAYLTWACGWGILAFGLAAVLGLYAYTGPPFQLKYRALGEPTIFILFGPLLMVGAAWAQTGRLEMSAFLLSLPVGLATTAILVGNNFRDREEDGQAGIRTLGHFAGGRVAQAAYIVLVVASTIIPAILAAAGMARPALAAAPLTLMLAANPLKATWKGRRIPDIDARTARWETALLGLMLAGCLL